MRVKKYDNIISRETRDKISLRYKKLTQAINNEFWNSNSDTDNSIYVGSYGRGTSITSSDIDVLVILPNEEFDRYNNLTGNTQSRLLQAVKNAIKIYYPKSDVRADGQIVKINFSDGIKFEVLPSFISWNGSYIYPDSNKGGKWLSTNPKIEQKYFKEKNKESNGLFVATCKHIRFLRDNYYKSYSLPGILIDSFVYTAMGNWKFIELGEQGSDPGSYEINLKNYFNENNAFWKYLPLTAPGSKDKINFSEENLETLEKVLNLMIKD